MLKRNRIFAILLALSMTVAYMPALAFAETGSDGEPPAAGNDLGAGSEEDENTAGEDIVGDENGGEEGEDIGGGEDIGDDETGGSDNGEDLVDEETGGSDNGEDLGAGEGGDDEYTALWSAECAEDDYCISKDNPEVDLQVVVDTSACDTPPELTYKWYDNNWEEISGAETDTCRASSEGNYFCRVTDEDGHFQDVWFYVNYQTDWTAEAADEYYYISSSQPEAELRVDVNTENCSSDPELRYQWYTGDWTSIEGEDSAAYNASAEGSYNCVVTDKDGHSSEVSFYVYYQTDWTAMAADGDYYISSSKKTAELTVVINTENCDPVPDESSFTYQWYTDDGNLIEDEESATYVASEIGFYNCVVTDKDGHTQGVGFYVSYQTDWSAWAEDGDHFISSSKTEAELTVGVEAGADVELTYKWYKYDDSENDWVLVKEDGSTTYTADSEGDYRCVVADESGHSHNVDFYVTYQTDWTVEAADGEYYISSSQPKTELRVEVDTSNCDPAPELTFSWYRFDDFETDWVLIDGATEAAYEVDSTGDYRCVVTDGDGHYRNIGFEVSYRTDWSAWSEESEVYISKSDPTAELRVETDASGTLTYQWYTEDWEEIDGATSDTYSAQDAGDYFCKVTDEEGHFQNVWFYVVYRTDWVIYDHDDDFDISKDKPTVALKVTIDTSECSPKPTFTYQWYKFDSNEDDWVQIDGATKASYTANSEGDYKCVVTDQNGDTNSDWFYVYYQTDWYAEAEEEYVIFNASDGTATLKVKVDTEDCDTPPELTYKWYKTHEGEERDELIEGAESDTYIATEEGDYVCTVTDQDDHCKFIRFFVSAWRAYSENSEVCLGGGSAQLKVKVAPEDFAHTYQWFRYHDDDEFDDAIEGETSDIFTATETGEYFCKVTSADDPENYKHVWFTVYPGHDWDESEEMEATCTEDGEIIYRCMNCGEEKTEIIPAHHTLKKVAAKAATYTAAGNKAYWKCTECGKFFGDANGKKQIKKDSWVIAKLPKKANPMKVKAVAKTVKAKNLKKKAQVVSGAVKFTKKAVGKVTYKGVGTNAKSKKALKINAKTGKITVKKKTKKGTYKMKVTVKDAGTTKYKAATKTVTVTIKVK